MDEKKQRTTWRRRRVVFWVLSLSLLMALNVLMTELRHRDMLSGPWLVAILVAVVTVVPLVLRYVVLPRLARRPPPFPRTERTDEWEAPAPQQEILRQLEDLLVRDEWHPRVEGSVLRATKGSDAVFRYRGSGSAKGWAELPLVATFRVVPTATGSHVVAEVRDDLGWYATKPEEFVATEVNHRAATLLRRAREATEYPAGDG